MPEGGRNPKINFNLLLFQNGVVFGCVESNAGVH